MLRFTQYVRLAWASKYFAVLRDRVVQVFYMYPNVFWKFHGCNVLLGPNEELVILYKHLGDQKET